MTQRVILGQRNGQHGAWVSKPGTDVLTASDDDMLMSSGFRAFQIVASGVINSPGNLSDHDRTFPDLGFQPMVLIGGNYGTGYSFPNATTVRIHVFSPWQGGGGMLTWAVTNQPILI